MGRPTKDGRLDKALAVLLHAGEHAPAVVAAAAEVLPQTARVLKRCTVEDGHWLWTGARSISGSPVIRQGANMRPVRLVLWEEIHGCKMTAGRVAAMGCYLGNDCVCPSCIDSISRNELMARVAATGVYSALDRRIRIAMAMRARSHVSDEAVQAVREAELPARDKAAREALAAQLGVSRGAINQWRRGAVRKDFSNPLVGLLP